MAVSYTELFDLRNDSGLINRTTVAVVTAADAIFSETTPVQTREDWAAMALETPGAEGRRMLWQILVRNQQAANADAIRNATDAQIQANVDQAITDRYGAAA